MDGAAKEGTPCIPAHGMRRLSFTPGPAGFRFCHTHVAAHDDLGPGPYTGQAGPVHIEPKAHPAAYDHEVFLVLKEFGPAFGQGGDMAQNFLAGSEVPALERRDEKAMAGSPARGMPHGHEFGYTAFGVNGRKLGHGPPIKVKSGQRVLFHVLNASATEIRSPALPGHTFEVTHITGTPTHGLRRTSSCSAATRPSTSTSPPTSRACPCSTATSATSNSAWTTAS